MGNAHVKLTACQTTILVMFLMVAAYVRMHKHGLTRLGGYIARGGERFASPSPAGLRWSRCCRRAALGATATTAESALEITFATFCALSPGEEANQEVPGEVQSLRDHLMRL